MSFQVAEVKEACFIAFDGLDLRNVSLSNISVRISICPRVMQLLEAGS
jgi:hypothetical protein